MVLYFKKSNLENLRKQNEELLNSFLQQGRVQRACAKAEQLLCNCGAQAPNLRGDPMRISLSYLGPYKSLSSARRVRGASQTLRCVRSGLEMSASLSYGPAFLRILIRNLGIPLGRSWVPWVLLSKVITDWYVPSISSYKVLRCVESLCGIDTCHNWTIGSLCDCRFHGRTESCRTSGKRPAPDPLAWMGVCSMRVKPAASLQRSESKAVRRTHHASILDTYWTEGSSHEVRDPQDSCRTASSSSHGEDSGPQITGLNSW